MKVPTLDSVVPGSKRFTRLRGDLLIATAAGCCYALIGCVWIVLSSDFVAGLASSATEQLALERYKGVAFVVVMGVAVAALVYVLRRRARHIDRVRWGRHLDRMTGLLNRSVAKAQLRERLAQALERGEPAGVLLFDVRRLRRINHALGHTAGDEVLRQVARRIRTTLGGEHSVAHWESDSFLVGLPVGTEKERALATARAVMARFEEPIRVAGREMQIDLSAGLAMAPAHGHKTGALIDAAARARERGAAEGTDLRVAGWEDTLGSGNALDREMRLRRAIRDRRLGVAFQPQVDLNTLAIVGVEALARWHDPDGRPVSPAEFIPMAESIGLIRAITEHVLDRAMAVWAQWRRDGFEAGSMSVNLSGRDLADGRIVERVAKLLHRYDMPGERLILEITEGWLMRKPELALSLLNRLRELGVRIAVDDFGTGYSSLNQLIRFPVDQVKIDRSFVAGADADLKKRAILEAVAHVATSLGASTVAEGAESFDELVLLKRLGFGQVQGYVFSPPVSAQTFVDTYLARREIPEFEAVRFSLDRLTGPRGRAA